MSDIPEAIMKLVEAKARLKTCDGYPEQVEQCKKALDDAIDERTTSSLPRKEVISIQPGDVIVLKCDVSLDADAHTACQVSLQNWFPSNKCIVVDGGMSLEVYREQDLKMVDSKPLDVEQAKAAFRSHPEDRRQEAV
jgi:hypothetical protein